MTRDDAARIRRAAVLIKDDMAADIARFEGGEFSARNVSTLFGNLAAAISALAGMVDLIAADVESAELAAITAPGRSRS